MEKFIQDLMFNNDFPDGTMVVKVSKDLVQIVKEAHPEMGESAVDHCI